MKTRIKNQFLFGIVVAFIALILVSLFSCQERIKFTALDGHQFYDKDLSTAWSKHLITVREIENDCLVHGVAIPIDRDSSILTHSIGYDSTIGNKWQKDLLLRKQKFHY